MPASKIWTGTLSFVLVSIPVEMVSALRRDRTSFHMMHRKDNSFLQRRMFCPKDNTFVPGEHIVNGYETDHDKYVIIRQEEYKAIEPKRSQSIEISSFADYRDIDPIYFDRPYYIMPRKGGLKSYQMLGEVMHKTGKVGIARLVLHTREHLVAVKAGDRLLELITLHFYDQVRDTRHILPDLPKPRQAAVEAMKAEIRSMAGSYEPQRYVDESRRRILEFLEEKARRGQTVTVEHADEEAGESELQEQEDLVSVLEESLSKVKSK